MHSPQPFLLVGITPEPFRPDQQKLVNRLFQQGLDYLYIRSRENDAAVWQQLLEKIDPAFYSRLILPANAPAEAAGGRYVRHIREAERQAGQQLTPVPGKLYSTSIHHLEEAPGLAGRFSLVFYSPVFPSISKAGYQPRVEWPVVEKQMENLRRQEGMPRMIALGGLCAENIGQVQAAGFQGAALLGALWQAAEPEVALAAIQAQIKDSRQGAGPGIAGAP